MTGWEWAVFAVGFVTVVVTLCMARIKEDDR